MNGYWVLRLHDPITIISVVHYEHRARARSRHCPLVQCRAVPERSLISTPLVVVDEWVAGGMRDDTWPLLCLCKLSLG